MVPHSTRFASMVVAIPLVLLVTDSVQAQNVQQSPCEERQVTATLKATDLDNKLFGPKWQVSIQNSSACPVTVDYECEDGLMGRYSLEPGESIDDDFQQSSSRFCKSPPKIVFTGQPAVDTSPKGYSESDNDLFKPVEGD